MSEIARLTARPKKTAGSGGVGLQSLGLDPARDSYLYVPPGYSPGEPAPLALMFHGAGGHARHGLAPLLDLADAAGLIIVAPASRGPTWDVIVRQYGPDVELIERVLARVFDEYAIDPARVGIGGFSDGASYALSLGITNGDLFTHVLAFSPGFMAPAGQRGSPRVFISHGVGDEVLPISRCSRKIVPQLQRAGYEVEYREFDGGHTVPPEIARDAVEWFAGAQAS